MGGNVKSAVNVPLGDKAALRVAAYYNQLGGYIDAVQPDLSVNENVNSSETFGGRLAFRFEPNERLTITPRLVYQEVRQRRLEPDRRFQHPRPTRSPPRGRRSTSASASSSPRSTSRSPTSSCSAT